MGKAPKRPAPPESWSPRIRDQAELEQVLQRLPQSAGVYVMRDRQGHVIYVGKARRLRTRVRQYFTGHDTRMFVPLLAKIVGDIETIVTDNDKEALLLENNLIKQHRPRFNVKLRDDKNYLVLRLDPDSRWPRLELVRRIRQDGAQYFGPYHSASSARSTLRVVNRHFQLRTCTDYTLDHRKRPCLQYQIGRCPGPCVFEVDREAYAEQVRDVGLFLSGRHSELIDGLHTRMEHAASELDFETAARLRDQIESIETSLQSQRIVGTRDLDQDVIGLYREGGQVEFVVLQIRAGKVLGTEAFSEKGMELPDPEVLASFLSAYYDTVMTPPDAVLLPLWLTEDDAAPLAEWLRETKGRKVEIAVPERGARKKLVALANRNAASNFVTRRNKTHDSAHALQRLRDRLKLPRIPRTIECYDISHIQGQEVVASMVVFVDAAPEKTRYRSFKIRGLAPSEQPADAMDATGPGNDDFANMYEVLSRRVRRAMRDEDAWPLPDLIVIDGGKGQLGRALAAMQDLGIPVGAEGVDVVALAKERRHALGRGREALAKLKEMPTAAADGNAPGEAYRMLQLQTPSGEADPVEVRPERIYVPGAKDPIHLRAGSSERHLMERIRDEAHRFAITHHRKRRGKRSLRSALDDVSGVGPNLKRALLRHFGSVAAIRRASDQELCRIKGVGPALAGRIRRELQQS